MGEKTNDMNEIKLNKNNNSVQVIKVDDMNAGKNAVEDKSIELISVTSEEYNGDDDNISFDESRLQQWNCREFSLQLFGAMAGIILLFGCNIQSAWGVVDFLKEITSNEDDWRDMDYGWSLLSENDDDFFASKHVVIAMVVLSWNVGAILGGILGAFIVPMLSKRAIYTLASVLMILSGSALTKHSTAFYCVKGRLVLGIVYGLVQLTVIVQAAESTTKEVRRWMLVIVAYICATAYLASISLFYKYDTREFITYSEENQAILLIAYTVIVAGLLALIFNFVFTEDTIPFLLNKGAETIAFKQMSRLKSQHLSMLDIRYEFERIRFEVAQNQLDVNRSLDARSNFVPLTTMCCIRILNLLFTSVPITLLLIWEPTDDESENKDLSQSHLLPTTNTPDLDYIDSEEVQPLRTLLILQCCRMFVSIFTILRGDKYHINRFCYKFGFVCGIALLMAYLIYMFIGAFNIMQSVLYFPITIIISMAFMLLPIPLDVIQYCQTADSYARIQNTWSLACAIFVEHLFHILLIVQMDMFFGMSFVFFVNGCAMMYFSLWLIRFMPNVVAIHPITVAVVARYPFKRAGHEETVHI